jgi:hypothetical protein
LDKALLSESVFDVNSFVDTVNDDWSLDYIKDTVLVKFLCNVTAWRPSTVEANNYYWFADNDSVDHHYQGDKNNIIYINRNRKTDDGVVCDVPPIKPVHFSVSLETPDTDTRKVIITNGNSVLHESDYTNLAVRYEITLTKDSENKYKNPVLVMKMVKVTATETTPPVLQYEWSTADQTYSDLTAPVFALSFTKLTKDPDSLYVNVKQSMKKTGEKIIAEDMSNPEKVEGGLLDMLSSAISAIGQDTPFEGNTFLGSIKRKVTSVFAPLADSVDGVSSTVDSALEVLPELKQVDEMIGTIQEVGSKIQEISDTAKPALEATAKAASAAAIQSCSMSQSATGKDFTFTSGNNYDLSTTTDSRQQLPYCKELNREHFLEPNCKVLVLAVGAGKQNLYVVDILS